ncbi:MAG TPA: AI-2E family transporter [Actinomycetota bacterium]|nr:AI-2E family transporter [Actinomycetota bacterium]
MADQDRVLTPLVTRVARWGIVAWATIGLLVLAFFAFRYVVYPIRIVFPPLVIAMIAVYLLNPIVTGLERRGLGRVWAALIVYLLGGAIVGTALYFLVPLVAEQATNLADALPRIVGQASEAFQDVVGRFGVEVGEAPVAPDQQTITAFFGRFVSIAYGIVEIAIIFILGPILGFYLLVDLPKIRRGLRAMIPARRRAEVESVLRKIGEAIGGFFRGQFLVALFVGIASSLVLLLVGLPFWAVVGLVAGLFNLIPLIGPFIGGAVAVVVAMTTSAPAGGVFGLEPGWPLAVGSAIALTVVQQLDNHILSPQIVGRTVRLHPVTVMLGLLIGGALLGLWGMLLAIPTIAAIKILILHAWDTRVRWPPTAEAAEGLAGHPVEGAGASPEPTSSSTEPATLSPPGSAPVAPPRAPQASGWRDAMRRIFARRPGDEAPDEPAPAPPAGSRAEG